MTKEELQFCDDNIINFESVKLGFTRNIPYAVMETYESLYRKYLDSQFSLTYWCGECVFDMLQRLMVVYDNAKGQVLETVFTLPDDVPTEIKEEIPQEAPKKKGRKKK